MHYSLFQTGNANPFFYIIISDFLTVPSCSLYFPPSPISNRPCKLSNSFGCLSEVLFFRKNSTLSLHLNVFPHVEDWEIDWKAEVPMFCSSEETKQKQAGYSASSHVLESRHIKTPHGSCFHYSRLEFPLKCSSLAFPHIHMIALPLRVTSPMTMIVIYH